MKKIYSVLLLAVLFISCVTTTPYIGKTYSPTKSIDFFFREADIERKFEIMGRVVAAAFADNEAFEKIAKEKGADAVLINPTVRLNTTVQNNSDTNSSEVNTTTETGNYIVYFIN